MALALPNWPARMCEKMAAAYLDISPSAFRARVRNGIYPKPIRDGGKVYWARLQLDRFIASQFGLAHSPDNDAGDDSWDDCK